MTTKDEKQYVRRLQIKYEYGEKLIVKANTLVEAYHDEEMTLQEQRLIVTALSKITPNMEVLDFINFTVEEFCDIYELNSKSIHKDIKSICEDMLKRTLHIQTCKDSWHKFQWFSDVKYRKGIIKIKFHDNLKPYLLYCTENRAYTKYLYKNVFKFKCKYTLRVYELLKQYQKFGTRKFDLNKFKLYIGIDKNKYHKFANFKLKVLTPIINEINGYTDLNIDCQELRHSRKITDIKFSINSNFNYSTNLEKTPKEKLIKDIISYYKNKTGFSLTYKYFIDCHRVVLIDLREVLERRDLTDIRSPRPFMVWLINESINKFDIESLKKIADY